MKLAVLSDIHAEFRSKSFLVNSDEYYQPYGELILPHKDRFKQAKIDAFIIAGDIHQNNYIREKLLDDMHNYYNIPIITVKGNHDYWNDEFPDPSQDLSVIDLNGKQIACATFWTKLDPVLDALNAHQFSDFIYCKDTTIEKWNAVHEFHKNFILSMKPDVVVTHHPPTYKCVTPKFERSNFNQFFVSNSDNIVIDSGAKLWISGHVHSCHDFEIGQCRVIVNPLGYPGEPGTATQVKIIELD